MVVLAVLGTAMPAGVKAEPASQPSSPAAGRLDAGLNHTCAILGDGSVRCWGYGGDGELGYGNPNSVGDDETPGSAGPVDLGAGRTATAISAGNYHTCAILDDGSVRCWGYGVNGQLGYGNPDSVGDDETPGSAGPVDLGAGHTAIAISAGGYHTCAILDDRSVRCWGFGGNGQLGYASPFAIGDRQTPASAGPVDLGTGRTAKAITAGQFHTCAILDDGSVRCWGSGLNGQLGYGATSDVGDVQTPGSVAPVSLGPGRTATAISAGGSHTCAVLDDGSVRCWGSGVDGELGYGDTGNVGDTQVPALVGPVQLGRRATAISAGAVHTCAILDNGRVRCWGSGADGQLGYGATGNVGDRQSPASIGPVSLGPGRTATAISAGGSHTCALLDDGAVRCWGYGGNGRLGYCNQYNVGDRQTPASAGPVDLAPSGPGCGGSGGGASHGPTLAEALRQQARRATGLRTCLARLARHPRATRSRGRASCLERYGRVPGRVTGVRADASSKARIVLRFVAPGTDGHRPPGARAYLIKQSTSPIRNSREMAQAPTLCGGSCRFSVLSAGTRITLTITNLQPRTTYYYAIAARDNVSGRAGPYSPTVSVTTR